MQNWKDTNHQAFYQIPAQLIKVGSRIFLSEICKLTNSSWNKEELPEKWKESIMVPIL